MLIPSSDLHHHPIKQDPGLYIFYRAVQIRKEVSNSESTQDHTSRKWMYCQEGAAKSMWWNKSLNSGRHTDRLRMSRKAMAAILRIELLGPHEDGQGSSKGRTVG